MAVVGPIEHTNQARILVIDHQHNGDYTRCVKSSSNHGGPVHTISAVELVRTYPKSQPLCKYWVLAPGTEDRFPEVARHMKKAAGWKGAKKTFGQSKSWPQSSAANKKYAELYGPDSLDHHWRLAMAMGSIYKIDKSFYFGNDFLGESLSDAQEALGDDPKRAAAFIKTVKKLASDRYGKIESLFTQGLDRGVIVKTGASYSFAGNHVGFSPENAAKILDKDAPLLAKLTDAVRSSPMNESMEDLIAKKVAEGVAKAMADLEAKK